MKVMKNAIEKITEKAEFLIDNLVASELNLAQKRAEDFEAWYTKNSVDPNSYGATYVYVATELLKRDISGMSNYAVYNMVMSYKSSAYIVELINLGRSEYQQKRFTEDFKNANMAKLKRAFGKHLTEDMQAENILVNEGPDGVEVTADVDGRKFYTFGVLCGGDVQRLHYRYRSNLK